MNSVAIDIADYLDEMSSLGLVFGTDVFVGREPPKPDNCVTIFDTYGRPPQLNMVDQGYEYPSIQIRVRNRNYEDGWGVISDIKDVLHGMNHTTINGTLYTVIYVSSGPTLLDWDENSRARFILNLELQRRD